MKKEFIDIKVNDALNSLEGMQRAEGNPYLFTRLETRMKEERSYWWKITSFITRPAVAFACICLVLVINAMVLFFANTTNKNNQVQPGSELAMADEYSQASTPAYDFENIKP